MNSELRSSRKGLKDGTPENYGVITSNGSNRRRMSDRQDIGATHTKIYPL